MISTVYATILLYLIFHLVSRVLKLPAEKKYTDKAILEALEECRKDPIIPAILVAEKLNANPRYISNLLIELEKKGILIAEKHANVLFFRPK